MPSQYVYHFLPDSMQGTILFPLNRLRLIHPEVAERHARKYDWRQEIMKRKIPNLNALWNDVLHFSVINPEKTFAALQALTGKKFGRQRKIVHIPIEAIEESSAVYFITSDDTRENLAVMLNHEIRVFHANTYVEQSKVSQEQITKWKENLNNNEPLLLFNKTTHLLYQRELDIKEFQVTLIDT